MDLRTSRWDVTGEGITVTCTHCNRDIANKEEIHTYFNKNVGYNLCENCCVNMLLLQTPTHIPYEQKLRYKLVKFLEEGG